VVWCIEEKNGTVARELFIFFLKNGEMPCFYVDGYDLIHRWYRKNRRTAVGKMGY
jgi:hypothetical protein